jgi:UDP-glucose 4-epimerase
MSYTTALVTGGSGFIGSHLVDALIERGVAVTVVDWKDPLPTHKNEKATYKKIDIRSADVEDVIVAAAPDVVFHLAAHINDRDSVADPVMNAEHNELGSIRVFQAAKRANASSIIFASTCAAYGLQELPIRESVRPQPRTPYGISKLAAETYLEACHVIHGTHTVALRFANVYGPRQLGNAESGAIAIFTEKLLANQSPFINDDGKTTRDFVYVGDVVRALLLAAETTESGVYNVGTTREVTTSEVFFMVQGAIGTTVAATPRPEVRDAVKRMALDISTTQRVLGWAPDVKLEEGIAETVAWYRLQGM